MGLNCSTDFLPEYLSVVDKSALILSVRLHGHRHNCPVQACNNVHMQVASFPGLHAQLLLLAVQKAGEGLDRFIT